MKTKHTEGPWTVEEFNNNGTKEKYGEIIAWKKTDEEGTQVPTHIAEIPTELWDKEGKANARLIAAAPDLLAKLKACRDALRNAADLVDEEGCATDKLLDLEDSIVEVIQKAESL